MNADLAVQHILANAAGVTAVVSDRIFYDEIDQTATVPLAIVTLQDVNPNDTKDGVSTLDFDKVAVYYMSSTKKEAASLALLGRTALDRASGTHNGVSVASIQFLTQSGFSEQLVDKKVHTIEQIYQVMTNN